MLNYAIFLKTESLLLEISTLTTKLYLTAGSFSGACLDYFAKLQDFADGHKLYFSSDISVATQKLITYTGETQNASGGTLTKRNLRKEKDSFAVKCLETVMREIKMFLDKDKKTYEECSEIWRQVVARLICKNPKIIILGAQEKIDVITYEVSNDVDLLPYYSHIIGLLGVFNAKAVLDTILPNLGL